MVASCFLEPAVVVLVPVTPDYPMARMDRWRQKACRPNPSLVCIVMLTSVLFHRLAGFALVLLMRCGLWQMADSADCELAAEVLASSG